MRETKTYKQEIVGTDEPMATAWVVKGQNWNGFCIPVFDKENAMKIANCYDTNLMYDEELDAFVEIFNPEWHETREDIDIWAGGMNKELGVVTYAIGACSWTWQIMPRPSANFLAVIPTRYEIYAVGETKEDARTKALEAAMEFVNKAFISDGESPPYNSIADAEEFLGCNVYELSIDGIAREG